MSVEIKPYTNSMGTTYPASVYVDGKLLPKQTLKAPVIRNGDTVVVECYTKGLGLPGDCVDPDNVPYQVQPYETRPDTRDSRVEITRFYLRYVEDVTR